MVCGCSTSSDAVETSMAITRVWPLIVLALATGNSWSREAATPVECKALAALPPLSSAIAKGHDVKDVRAQMALADAWSDAGCYSEAVAQLQSAVSANPGVPELQTRLRVANSLVGEERFFDDLDRADRQAKIKRDTFRCSSLADLDACNEAVRLQPDVPELQIALGDGLMRSNRPLEALQQYRRAQSAAADKQALLQKIHAAEEQLSAASAEASSTAGNSDSARVARSTPAARRYTNVSQTGQSH
jgi:tetratricopeptide (TPR) repeat protein